MERFAWLGAAAASAVIGAGFILADTHLLRESIYVLALVATCLAMFLGAHLHRPRPVHPIAILMTAFSLLTVSYAVRHPLWSSPTTELVGGVIVLIAYPLIAVASLALVRLQAPGGDREGAIDGTIVMIAMATLLAGTVFDTSQLGTDADVVVRVNMIVAPLLLSVVMAATFRLLFVGSARVPSAWLLVSAAGAGLIGNVIRTVMDTGGTYQRGTWVDLILLSAFVFVAMACLHPSLPTLTEPTEPGSRRLTHARLGVLGAALIAAPATLAIQEPGIGLSLPIVSSIVLSLLVLWRLARLVIEREAVRLALHERAARQEALAEIGRHALDDPDLDSLFEEVARCCRQLLDLDSCSVVPPGADVPDHAVCVEVDHLAGSLVAARHQYWNDEDLAFLHAAGNILTGAYRRQQDQDTMRHRAVHDALTGLPNRVLIIDRIEQALARRDGGPVTVLFLDLDGFKLINDVYGHQVGDDVLIQVAARLRGQIRSADTVGRLAGDEFVVVCDQTDRGTALQLADRLVAALSEPLELDCGGVRVGTSIGIATSSATTESAERLLGEADLAMYQAKEQLGSAVATFDQDLGQERSRRRGLEIDLAAAVEQGSLRLAYQPLFAIGPAGSNQMVGVEALLRWDHPVHGPIPPLEFIPLAEATGLILPLGDQVISGAIAQLAPWAAGLPDDVPFTVWVNLSPHQLADHRLPERIARTLAEAGVPPWRFGCEVTETAILTDPTVPVLAELRELGVKLALDDFGTGFSSLSHLKRITIDLVKIDRSFIRGVTHPGGDRAIVQAVTAVARELGVAVVGEGVETADQLQALHELGCDHVQGYLLGRPVAPEHIVAPQPTGEPRPTSSATLTRPTAS